MKMPGQKWYGQMSLPRELSVVDGRLYQKPLSELETLRSGKVVYENVLISSKNPVKLDGISGRRADMEITIRPADANNIYRDFVIYFAQNDKYHTSISFRPEESILKVDRKFSGSRRALLHERSCLTDSVNGILKLRIILDRFSAEVFVGDGEQVMSTVIYTPQEAAGISFAADGDAVIDVTKYELM
jgi:beta-fructofuranosidase